MSLFDGIQKTVFSNVQAIFGDTAIWNPLNLSAQQTTKVLFNKPDSVQTLGDSYKTEYQPYKYWFEYYQDQFTGLKTSVDAGNVERVIIGNASLDVRQVIAKYDGKTMVAFCEESYVDLEGVGNDSIQSDLIIYEQGND
jgi:hypothetical protein